MAVFGAPVAHEDDANARCGCSDMMTRLVAFITPTGPSLVSILVSTPPGGRGEIGGRDRPIIVMAIGQSGCSTGRRIIGRRNFVGPANLPADATTL